MSSAIPRWLFIRVLWRLPCAPRLSLYRKFRTGTKFPATLVRDNPLGEYEGAIPTECPDFLFADDFEQAL